MDDAVLGHRARHAHEAVEPGRDSDRIRAARHDRDHGRQRVVALGRREVQHARARSRRTGTSRPSTRGRSTPGACRRTSARRAPPGLVRLGAHPADHAGLQPGPVVRRRGRGRQRAARRRPTASSRSSFAQGGQSWMCASIAIISPTGSSRSWKAASRRRTAAQVRSVIRPSIAPAGSRARGPGATSPCRPRCRARSRSPRSSGRRSRAGRARSSGRTAAGRARTGSVRRAASGRRADRATSRCPAPAGSP